MVTRLDCHPEDYVWEPCGGDGALVEGVLRACPGTTICISEIDRGTADTLEQRYDSHSNISVFCEDALQAGSEPLFGGYRKFSRIIGNPPYGAWQPLAKRAELKKKLPGLYVRDTYAVFLAHCLNQLKAGGRLVFIIPDTFLWLNRHETLRRKLLMESTIEEIALFPSHFFPNINFGYSGLSIITLIKEAPRKGASIRVIDQISRVEALNEFAKNRFDPDLCVVTKTRQEEILSEDHCVVPRSSSRSRVVLKNKPFQYLREIAELKTGFYSGNDRNWLRRANSSVPRSKSYRDVQPDQIAVFEDGRTPSLDGIDGKRYFIPILKGGASPFIKHTSWFIDWSTHAVEEYRRPGKNPARFQNSQYYFRQGIGIPMVASSKLTAAWLDNRLIDQSIVGLFPKERRLSLYLLGFLNTRLATGLLRQINGTANNSANYLKRLPIISPSERELAQANELVKTAYREVKESNILCESTAKRIENFYNEVWYER